MIKLKFTITFTLSFFLLMYTTYSQGNFKESTQRMVDLIAGTDDNLSTWTACSTGNLFYHSDTISFIKVSDISYLPNCYAFLTCSIKGKFSLFVESKNKIYSSKQMIEKYRNHHRFLSDPPMPDSLVVIDSSELLIQYVEIDSSLILIISKASTAYYSLRVISIDEIPMGKNSDKIQRLTAVRRRF